MQPMKIDVHGLSLPGEMHDKNHDHFAIATLSKSMRVHQTNLSIDDDSRVHGQNQGQLFLVADGIGGGSTPARASGAAVDGVVQYFLNEMPWYHLADGEPDEVIMALEDAFRNSQDELRRDARLAREGSGTTMTLAFVFWPDLYVAHVGDSRCYLSRHGSVRRLTTDRAPALPRGRGRDEPLQPEVHHLRLEPGDGLALVTDGVVGSSSDHELRSILESQAPAEELCSHLVGGPGSDDRTAIAVRFLPLEEVPARATGLVPPTPLGAAKDPRPSAATPPGARKGPPVNEPLPVRRVC